MSDGLKRCRNARYTSPESVLVGSSPGFPLGEGAVGSAMAKVAFWFVESTVARIVGGALSDLLLPHQAGRKEPLQSPLAAGYTTLGCLSGNHITDGKGLSAATAPDNETRTSLTPAAPGPR
mmetsp:Transcript_14669/g.41257  ORF Transcript_14669/g.41257 Transcript_14669/m.41257 type:complete len:121 (-) Transcript_14669:197-559(-)